MSDSFARARQLFLDGVSLFEAGRHEQAEANFEAALALVPGRVSKQRREARVAPDRVDGARDLGRLCPVAPG